MSKGYSLNVPNKMIVSDPDEVNALVKHRLSEKYQENALKWLEILEKENTEDAQSIRQAMERLVDITKELQVQGKKDSIAFIMLYFLRSSILDGSFSILIQTTNRNIYFDEVETQVEWVPITIRRLYEEAIEDLKTYIKRNNIVISQNEINIICRKHYEDYVRFLPKFFHIHIGKLIEEGMLKDIVLDQECNVLFSSYMGEAMPIYHIGQEEI